MVEVLHEIKKLRDQVSGKFEKTRGVRIWGEDEEGSIRLLRVDEDGKLVTTSP